MTIRVISIAIVLHCSALAKVDEHRMLSAIAEIEGGNIPGRHGEVGLWQMMPSAVRHSGGHGYYHALTWLRYIIHELSRRGVDPNVYNIALAWNCSIATVASGRAPMKTYDYACRTENIYYTRASR